MKILGYSLGIAVVAPLVALAVMFGAFLVILLYAGELFGDLVMRQ